MKSLILNKVYNGACIVEYRCLFTNALEIREVLLNV